MLTAGYNYDFCCVDDLRELVQVKNGRITAPSGATYAVLSLGPDRYLTLPTLNKIYQLLQDVGSSASRRPSPMKFRENIVRLMAAMGKNI